MHNNIPPLPPLQSVFKLVNFVLNCISSCVLPSELSAQILKGTNCPLGCFFKGQYQCGIGTVAWPSSNPGTILTLTRFCLEA